MSSIDDILDSAANYDVESFEVAELGGLEIFHRPLTARDMNKLQRKHKGFPESMSFEAIADLIIFKAEDKKGEPIFTLAHKPKLMSLKTSLISEIAARLLAGRSDEEMEKN